MITGVVNIYNEYEELIETNYVAADGIVYAQTKYQYQQAFPLDYTQKRQGKKKKTGITIQLGNSVKTLHQPKLVDGYEQVSTTHTFHIGKAYYLPFSVTVTKYYQPIYETKTYTEEEARKSRNSCCRLILQTSRKRGGNTRK